MAAPTEAEVQAQTKRLVAVLHKTRDNAEITATTFVSHFDTIAQAVEGDHVSEELDAVEAFRSRYASLMSQGSAAALLIPELLHYARAMSWPDTDPGDIFTRLYDEFIANAKRVKSRDISFGAVSAGGSNAGNGTINRLVVDENSFEIEATNVEVKTFECTFDANSASEKGEERFEVRGEDASKDGMETLGSGLVGELRALSARDSAQYLNNPSFSTYDPTATPRFNSWTLVSGTTPTQDTTNYYRLVPGETSGASAVFGANAVLEQAFSVKGAKLAPGQPYYLQIAYNRQVGSFAGDLKITFGNTTKTVSLAAQTGWNVLRLDLANGLWFKNANKQDLSIKIEVLNYSAGTLLVDDVIFSPMAQVDGIYYAIVGGSTPFLRKDIFTFTDTGGAAAKLQYWFWRLFGRYLPAVTDASETWTDP
jgi:hypothetical protein